MKNYSYLCISKLKKKCLTTKTNRLMKKKSSKLVYGIIIDWNDDDNNGEIETVKQAYTDIDKARAKMRSLIRKDRKLNEDHQHWWENRKDENEVHFHRSKDSYYIGEAGRWDTAHYAIWVQSFELPE